jgi:hypothetical protein
LPWLNSKQAKQMIIQKTDIPEQIGLLEWDKTLETQKE